MTAYLIGMQSWLQNQMIVPNIATELGRSETDLVNVDRNHLRTDVSKTTLPAVRNVVGRRD
jgi:hypothetical protein